MRIVYDSIYVRSMQRRRFRWSMIGLSEGRADTTLPSTVSYSGFAGRDSDGASPSHRMRGEAARHLVHELRRRNIDYVAGDGL